ncbi:DNA-directed RNA polymerase specialized sigma24 family protein [Promicromonospora sp. AC04]|uniref:zf-HC2 domain-containing protein n=1 Tax=Promicromonospora sp. AC04 TaxID=2135723 RepID=UPI000D36B1A5|nr:zf-HC2 domain-containing protein [Promicromonospora sp. AC04]PUB20293.1 DNA-directed RNA polymerase specialized sigma24 family protein [Promicromonospora sp. AC04]
MTAASEARFDDWVVHRPNVVRSVAARVPGIDAEEAASRALEKMVRLVSTGTTIEDPAPYWRRAAVNEAISMTREAGRTRPVEDDTLDGLTPPVAGAERQADVTMLRSALSKLADDDRKILFDRHVHDRAVTDIAGDLGVRPHAVTMRLRRAEERLAGAFAAAHAQAVNEPECRTTRAAMHDYLKGRLLPRRRGHVEAHMDGCAECTRAFMDVREVSWMLRDLGQHLVAGAVATGALGALGAGAAAGAGAAGAGAPKPSFGKQEAAIAAAVLAALGIGGGAAALIANQPDDPPAAESAANPGAGGGGGAGSGGAGSGEGGGGGGAGSGGGADTDGGAASGGAGGADGGAGSGAADRGADSGAGDSASGTDGGTDAADGKVGSTSGDSDSDGDGEGGSDGDSSSGGSAEGPADEDDAQAAGATPDEAEQPPAPPSDAGPNHASEEDPESGSPSGTDPSDTGPGGSASGNEGENGSDDGEAPSTGNGANPGLGDALTNWFAELGIPRGASEEGSGSDASPGADPSDGAAGDQSGTDDTDDTDNGGGRGGSNDTDGTDGRGGNATNDEDAGSEGSTTADGARPGIGAELTSWFARLGVAGIPAFLLIVFILWLWERWTRSTD